MSHVIFEFFFRQGSLKMGIFFFSKPTLIGGLSCLLINVVCYYQINPKQNSVFLSIL